MSIVQPLSSVTTSSIQTRMTRQQREVVGILSIGTFLEYFDLMLYVQMAVLLNDLFFPKTDAFTAKLLSGFAFCTTYAFRPIGALIFGYIGDKISRKNTVVITTLLMATCCICMGLLPTYAEWGLLSSILMLLCRAVQGMSSMGEKVGAEIFITESLKRPLVYKGVGFIQIACSLGGTFALIWCIVGTSENISWRWAFYFGASVACIGSFARIRLRETPEFADAQTVLKNDVEDIQNNVTTPKTEYLKTQGITYEKLKDKVNLKLLPLEKLNKVTLLAYFLVCIVYPVMFYFVFVYCPDVMKHQFKADYTTIFKNDLMISALDVLTLITLVYLSQRIHPLKILKFLGILFFPLVIIVMLLFKNASSVSDIFVIQVLVFCFGIQDAPATPIFYKHFPVLKRFRAATYIYASSRIIMYLVITFGMIFFTEKYGYIGLLFLMIPIGVGFYWAICHFQKLEVLSEMEEKKRQENNLIEGTKEYNDEVSRVQEAARKHAKKYYKVT